MEGAVGDVLSSEADGDDILPGFRCRVVNVEGSICVFYHVHVQFCPIGRRHFAGDFTFASCLGVHRDDCLLTNLDGRANP